MLAGSVARRYARALCAIGAERGHLDRLVAETANAAEMLEHSREARRVLGDPRHPIETRRAIVRDLCDKVGSSDVVRNAFLLLLDRGRIGIVGAVARELARLADAHEGRVRARVTAAAALPAAYLQRLGAELERLTGRRVVVEAAVDPALLAGVRAQIGDLVYDGSARAQIHALRAQLLSD